MEEEKKNLTPEQRKKQRQQALNKIAKAAGWENWKEYVAAVKKEKIKIQNKPAE